MLQFLEQRCEQSAKCRLTTHHTDALNFLSEQQTATYDLVVTNFFLDCLTQPELESLATAIAPILTPDALWLVSDFRIPPGPMHLPAKIFVRTLYFVFRIVAGLRVTHLTDFVGPLNHIKLTRIAVHYSLAGMLTTELWQLSSPDRRPAL